MVSKAQYFISLCEERLVTVALHDPGSKEDNGYYSNADIFGFELWDVPYEDSIIKGKRISKNYVGLFNNMIPILKKDIRKYNLSKQRIGFERSRVERIYIPDKVWSQLKITNPRADQKLLMQCLYILYKSHNVRIAAMQDMATIEYFWS